MNCEIFNLLPLSVMFVQISWINQTMYKLSQFNIAVFKYVVIFLKYDKQIFHFDTMTTLVARE